MFSDEDLLPISALQHLMFCERQCGLIHLEQVWSENRLTVEGKHLHEKAHEGPDEWREGVRSARGVPLRSLALGLIGQADVVEFQPPDLPQFQKVARVAAKGLFDLVRQQPAGWRVTPVEYKRGRPKKDDSDAVQLAAQAMCLEEMLGLAIPSGVLFYGQPRRRTEVPLDGPLRDKVTATARRLHALIASQKTPPAVREKKCDNCSLVDLCLPGALRGGGKASDFTVRQFDQHLASAGPQAAAFDE